MALARLAIITFACVLFVLFYSGPCVAIPVPAGGKGVTRPPPRPKPHTDSGAPGSDAGTSHTPPATGHSTPRPGPGKQKTPTPRPVEGHGTPPASNLDAHRPGSGTPPPGQPTTPRPGQGSTPRPKGASSPGSKKGPGKEGAETQDPNWTSEEGTFDLNVEGEGEGALSESGRPGSSWKSSGSGAGSSGSSWKSSGSGAGSSGASGSRDYKLSDYRESDKSLAAAQVKGQIGGGNVKNFDGGRNDKERSLFSGIKSKYDNLKEVDAVNSDKGNWGAKNRGSDRYIFGTPKDGPKKGPINLGVARHTPSKNDFDQFKQWKGT